MSDTGRAHDQLELYTSGALTDSEMIAFDDHLQLCRDCQARAPRLFEVAAALIPDSPASDHTWNRIVEAIERR
jgi:hypothetical protein